MPQSIRPLKHLGQNFLTDPNIARKIVASVPAPPDARVVEIGPGTGALTALLAEQYEDLVALELDPRNVGTMAGEMEAAGFGVVRVEHDLAGRERFVLARR